MSQRGMTLIELLVALAVGGVLITAAVPTIFQIVRGTDLSRTHLSALQDIEHAARWISEDGQMAQTTDLIDGAAAVDSVTLSWTDWFGGAEVAHSSSYYLLGTELKRNYDGYVTTVAEYISDIQFSLADRVITVSMTSSPEGEQWPSEQRTYYIKLRPIEGSPIQ